MIVADRKPFKDIVAGLKDYDRVLILGCGTCVAVCMAGGEREVALLASELRIASRLAGKNVEIGETTIQRQCDREYIEPIIDMAKDYDIVLSLACGAGVQMVADILAPHLVAPGLNTRFIGITEAEGKWAERCLACGDCLLGEYGGICPVTTCTKGLLNGPCGGATKGKCEAGDGRDCAWELIYNRLKSQGRLENLGKLLTIKDYRKKDHPMHQVNQAYIKQEAAASAKQ